LLGLAESISNSKSGLFFAHIVRAEELYRRINLEAKVNEFFCLFCNY
jgi:hypothetical protein